MGMLLAAMAGAGDAGVKSMDQEIEQLGRKDLMDQQAKLQLQTAQSLEQYKIELAKSVRQAEATELNTARTAVETSMLHERIKAGRGADAGEFDPATITPEERTKYALDDKARALALQTAGLQTGQLSAKDAATLDHKEGQLAAQLQLGQQRLELQAAIGQARMEAVAARGANNTDVRVAEGYLNLAKDKAKDIELMPDSNPQKAVLQKEITELRTKALGLFNQAIGGPAAAAGGDKGQPAPNPAAFDRSAKGAAAGTGAAAAPAGSSDWTKKLTDIAAEEGLTPTQVKFFRAMTGVESSNGKNTQDSPDGAIGPGQMMPGTFKQYARPGMEDIRNGDHNLHAAARYVKFLGDKTGDDAARMAVGYQSGPGNINPKGDTPWLADRQDGLGTKVSQYVERTQAKLKALEEADAKVGQAAAAAKPADDKPAPEKAAAAPLPPELKGSSVDDRVAAAAKEKAWKEEAEAMRLKRLREDAAGITADRVDQMTSSEANKVLAKYEEVLDQDLVKKLKKIRAKNAIGRNNWFG